MKAREEEWERERSSWISDSLTPLEGRGGRQRDVMVSWLRGEEKGERAKKRGEEHRGEERGK